MKRGSRDACATLGLPCPTSRKLILGFAQIFKFETTVIRRGDLRVPSRHQVDDALTLSKGMIMGRCTALHCTRLHCSQAR